VNKSIYHNPTDIDPTWFACKNAGEISIIFDSGRHNGIKAAIYNKILSTNEWQNRWHEAFDVVYSAARERDDFEELLYSLKTSSYSFEHLGAALSLIIYEDEAELIYEDPAVLLTMAIMGNIAATLLYEVCLSLS